MLFLLSNQKETTYTQTTLPIKYMHAVGRNTVHNFNHVIHASHGLGKIYQTSEISKYEKGKKKIGCLSI